MNHSLNLMTLLFLLISLFVSTTNLVANDVIFETYEVVDGDTLKKNNKRYRLQGIDAPELKQICKIKEKKWSCGKDSKKYLLELHKDNGFYCIKIGEDFYKRDLVKCYIKTSKGLEDIGSLMVREGYALSYRKYSKDYNDEEELAKLSKNGMWKGDFENPWEWRKKN